MSATDRLMLIIGSHGAWDVYRQFLNQGASEIVDILRSRAATLASTILTLWLALVQSAGAARLADMDGNRGDADLLRGALFAGLYWRRATREGALASMILGLLGAGIFSYYTKYIASCPCTPACTDP